MTKSNIFQTIGFSQEDSEILELKAGFLFKIQAYIEDLNMSQKEMAILLNLSQADISYLSHHKSGRYSLEKLIRIAYRLGININLKLT